MNKKVDMLRAASLIYAIFISLLIGILCYAILLMFSLNLSLENHFKFHQSLLMDNSSAVEYLTAEYKAIGGTKTVNLFPNEIDIETSFTESQWGVFSKYAILTMSKKDSVRQDVLLANKHYKKAPALYLRDNDLDLKIAGKTEVKGDIYISDRGLKKTTITGNSGFYEPKFTGEIYRSNKILPPVEAPVLKYPENYQLLLIDEIPQDRLINTFDKKTKVIEAGSILENLRLKGNIIVRSKDTLTIFPSAELEDIIIDAPKVIFLSGVEGNVQVFSNQGIILEKEVKLKYPSVLVVSSDDPSLKKKITIGENSRVKGAILLFGNGVAYEDKNSIVIENDAEITGDIYCDGNLSLYGIVKGSVFASKLFYRTENTQYDNLIFNGKILSDELPEDFFQMSLLEDFKNEEPIIIKKI